MFLLVIAAQPRPCKVLKAGLYVGRPSICLPDGGGIAAGDDVHDTLAHRDLEVANRLSLAPTLFWEGR